MDRKPQILQGNPFAVRRFACAYVQLKIIPAQQR